MPELMSLSLNIEVGIVNISVCFKGGSNVAGPKPV